VGGPNVIAPSLLLFVVVLAVAFQFAPSLSISVARSRRLAAPLILSAATNCHVKRRGSSSP